MSVRIDVAAGVNAAGRVLGTVLRFVLPSLLTAGLRNVTIVMRTRGAREPQRRSPTPGDPSRTIDAAAAAALWQSESARMTGLATKGAGVLAAQALVAGALTTMSTSHPSRTVTVMLFIAIIYLACGLVTAVIVLLPQPVWSVTVNDVVGDDEAGAMLTVVGRNISIASRMSNWVTASVGDTARSLALVLTVLVWRLLF